MKKERHNPDKKQNNCGGDYDCTNFDIIGGEECCHDEGQQGWREWIKWDQKKDGKLVCKGNRHNCFKLRQKWLASLSEQNHEKQGLR